jgi:hypothetical protein
MVRGNVTSVYPRLVAKISGLDTACHCYVVLSYTSCIIRLVLRYILYGQAAMLHAVALLYSVY